MPCSGAQRLLLQRRQQGGAGDSSGRTARTQRAAEGLAGKRRWGLGTTWLAAEAGSRSAGGMAVGAAAVQQRRPQRVSKEPGVRALACVMPGPCNAGLGSASRLATEVAHWALAVRWARMSCRGRPAKG